MRPLAHAAAALAALALCGCVSLKRSSEARYYVLRSLAEPAAAAEPVPVESQLGLLPVSLPESLARAELVAGSAPGELRVDPLRRWAEPLDEGVTRTLAENLGALLPRCRTVRHPWPAATALRARLQVELRAFGPQADGTVRLDGVFTLLDGRQERALQRRPFSLSRPAAGAAGGGDLGTVEAMSALLADLARQVAAAVETLPASAGAGS